MALGQGLYQHLTHVRRTGRLYAEPGRPSGRESVGSEAPRPAGRITVISGLGVLPTVAAYASAYSA